MRGALFILHERGSSMNIIKSILTKNPCYTGGRTITVKGLMLHSVGCPQPKASVFINSWNSPSYGSACVHGFIDGNTGDIYQTLPWNWRGWHGGGACNNTHIGVEMCEPACIRYTSGSSFTCSDLATAKAVAKRTYKAAVELFAYLCKQYGLDPLKDGVVISHKEGHARGIATNHGDPEHLWNGLGMGYTMNGFRKDVKAAMSGTAVNPAPTATKTTASAFKGLSEKDAAAKCLELCRQDAKKTGIFASVSAAQMILESGYVTTDLAQNANNCFGMKCNLSGNTWPGSTWDGKSKYTKKTGEQKPDGTSYTVTADFRKYPCIEDSIADHSAYILGAKNGSALRYAGVTKAKDYKEQITIIKNGGYATDVNYVSKVCSIIERYGLNKYDCEKGSAAASSGTLEACSGYVTVIYTGKDGIDVHTTPAWGSGNVDHTHGPVGPATNKGTVFTVVGKIMVDGTLMYKLKSGLYITGATKYVKFSTERPQEGVQASKFPYTVKVTTDALNVRTGPGTGYTVVQTIRDRGIYTIMEEKTGKGANLWGRLKSGAGWIALDYTKKC